MDYLREAKASKAVRMRQGPLIRQEIPSDNLRGQAIWW
jgi:hypothetical protein